RRSPRRIALPQVFPGGASVRRAVARLRLSAAGDEMAGVMSATAGNHPEGDDLTMWTRVCGVLALVAVGVALGCGGSGEDKDKEAAGKDCGQAPAAMSGQPQLPTGFPQPAEVTYTGQVANGPASIVQGHFARATHQAL